MNDILDLRETSANNWTAKYQGNYGVYTIRITNDGKRTTKFSCSCPSDNVPCKHIAMIEAAIAKRIAKSKKNAQAGTITAEELLKDVSLEELRDFMVRQAKYNSDIHNALLMEFAPRIGNKRGNEPPRSRARTKGPVRYLKRCVGLNGGSFDRKFIIPSGLIPRSVYFD